MGAATKLNRRLIASMAALLLVVGTCGGHEGSPFVIPLQAEHTAPGHALAARLDVNGQEAWFMFDTGAGVHTLARWFVDAAGIAIDDGASDAIQARDATGEPVEIRVARGLVGRLPDGRALALESAIVADFPPEFQELGVGGLLNPQLLASADRAVVLDLRVPELRFENFEDAVRRLGARILRDDELQACVDADTPIPNLLFAVLVSAGGEETAWLQLDTGAGKTSIVASSRLVDGLELEPGGEMMGIAGRRQAYTVAPDLAIAFGSVRASVDAEVVERTHRGCGPHGLVGRDVLGSCALVLRRESVAISCD